MVTLLTWLAHQAVIVVIGQPSVFPRGSFSRAPIREISREALWLPMRIALRIPRVGLLTVQLDMSKHFSRCQGPRWPPWPCGISPPNPSAHSAKLTEF